LKRSAKLFASQIQEKTPTSSRAALEAASGVALRFWNRFSTTAAELTTLLAGMDGGPTLTGMPLRADVSGESLRGDPVDMTAPMR